MTASLRFVAALSVAALAGCRESPPAPVVFERPAADTSGGGVPGPTADEVEAGIDLIEDALRGSPGP